MRLKETIGQEPDEESIGLVNLNRSSDECLVVVLPKSAHLDGLRGVAALSVAIWHGYQAYFWDRKINGRNVPSILPLSFLLNGPHMVTIFFALSGRVLVERIYKSPPSNVTDVLRTAVLRRQLRLLLPVYATCVLIWLATRTGIPSWSQHLYKEYLLSESADGGNGATWHDMSVASNSPFPSTYEVFGQLFLNREFTIWKYAVFWTLPMEILGSDIIYFLTSVCLDQEISGLIILLIVFVFMNSWGNFRYSPFVGGLLLCHLRFGLPKFKNRYSYVLSSLPCRALKIIVVAICFAISIIFWGFTNEQFGVGGQMAVHAYLEPFADVHRFGVAAAMATIFWIDESHIGRALFSLRPLQFLGKISFGLYLVHGGCITTIASPLISCLRLYTSVSYAFAVCVGVFVGLMVALLMGWWFVTVIDTRIITISHQVTEIFLGTRSIHEALKALQEAVHESFAATKRKASFVLQRFYLHRSA